MDGSGDKRWGVDNRIEKEIKHIPTRELARKITDLRSLQIDVLAGFSPRPTLAVVRGLKEDVMEAYNKVIRRAISAQNADLDLAISGSKGYLQEFLRALKEAASLAEYRKPHINIPVTKCIAHELNNLIAAKDKRFRATMHITETHFKGLTYATMSVFTEVAVMVFDELDLNSSDYRVVEDYKTPGQYIIEVISGRAARMWDDVLDHRRRFLDKDRFVKKYASLVDEVAEELPLKSIRHGGFLSPIYSGIRMYSTATLTLQFRQKANDDFDVDLVLALTAPKQISRRVQENLPQNVQKSSYSTIDMVLIPSDNWKLSADVVIAKILHEFPPESLLKRLLHQLNRIRKHYMMIPLPNLTVTLSRLISKLTDVIASLHRDDLLKFFEAVKYTADWEVYLLMGYTYTKVFPTRGPNDPIIQHIKRTITELNFRFDDTDPAGLRYLGETSDFLIDIPQDVFTVLVLNSYLTALGTGEAAQFATEEDTPMEAQIVSTVLKQYQEALDTTSTVKFMFGGEVFQTRYMSTFSELSISGNVSELHKNMVRHVTKAITSMH